MKIINLTNKKTYSSNYMRKGGVNVKRNSNGLYMTVEEMMHMYNKASNKGSQVAVLADLNNCSVERILEVIRQNTHLIKEKKEGDFDFFSNRSSRESLEALKLKCKMLFGEYVPETEYHERLLDYIYDCVKKGQSAYTIWEETKLSFPTTYDCIRELKEQGRLESHRTPIK